MKNGKTENKRERVNRILKHEKYNKYLKLNETAEENREFCRHDMAHLLDVARLAAILNLKETQEVEEELIYAAALLHDIGRYLQYENKMPHEKAGAALAPEILRDCGFDGKETEAVTEAIIMHRDRKSADTPGLTGLLYRADKMSRSCFSCKAEAKCSWNAEKKNLKLVW